MNLRKEIKVVMAANEEKLVRMLKYVSEHNDFYKNRIKEYGITNPLDIMQWPVLTRKELQENRYNMFSDGYDVKYFYQQLHRQFSSGSSGIPVNVYWDYQDLYASNLSLWRKRKRFYGVLPSDKQISFNLHAFGDNSTTNSLYYKLVSPNILLVNISLIHENNRYADLIEIISDYKPSWLYIQPYILNKLLNIYAEKNQTPPASLKYIEVYGEMVFPGLKERVKEVFNVPIAIMYGSEEMNCIAYEWHENKMQIVNENVFVEHLSDGHISDCTGEGVAIITNLNNHAMPLIRYDQGDVISLEADKAKFEYHIVSIKGRKLDSIMVNKNTEINSFILQEIIAEANNQFKDIISFYRYFYYARERELRCSINVKKMEWFDSVKEFIKSSFKMKVGNIGITFEVNRSFDENDFNNKFKFLEIIN